VKPSKAAGIPSLILETKMEMKTKKSSFRRSSRQGSSAGFTLPEVMISTVVGFLLIGVALSAFSYQQRAANAGKSLTEMNQNIRTVLEAVGRELKLSGYGLDIVDSQLPDWIDFAKDSSESFTYNFNSNPLIVEGLSGGPDKILAAGAFDPPVATLSAAATTGQTTIALSALDVAKFNTTDQKVIYIGRSETARITGIFGSQLSISTDPLTIRGLKYSHESGSPIELVKVISFEWMAKDSNVYPREPHVIRYDSTKDQLSWSWQRMLSSHIEDIQYTDNGDDTITLSVTGRSSTESPFYVDTNENDNYRRETISSTVYLRNAL
jgi:type II secretory pathway pseudopilin PulG